MTITTFLDFALWLLPSLACFLAGMLTTTLFWWLSERASRRRTISANRSAARMCIEWAYRGAKAQQLAQMRRPTVRIEP